MEIRRTEEDPENRRPRKPEKVQENSKRKVVKRVGRVQRGKPRERPRDRSGIDLGLSVRNILMSTDKTELGRVNLALRFSIGLLVAIFERFSNLTF